jgi:putative addiction module component (TIGR02574 family)
MNILAPEEVARLSVRERLALIERLWDRLDDSGVPVTPAEQAELARRLATFEDDRADEVTWDQLKAELSARRP